MGKIENSLLYQMFVLGGASSGGNVPEKENPYLPDAADGYTEYADIAELTVSDIRNCGIGSTLNAKIALNTGITVGDKVLLTGRILNSGSDVVLYAVWGTANYYHDYTTYARVRFVVAGSSIRPFTADTVTINSNGTTNVFGASKVNVSVESVQTEPLYVNENGDYYPESGYAYGEVHVDVQGGSEPNLQSKAVTVTQNVTQIIEPDSGYDGLSDVALTVNVSGGGTVEAEEKDVNFIDYDGTILYSYTADEFAGLSALPANPSHAGLTAQGWNWTLSDAQSYVANNGMLWIGQMYITDDGKTRLYIHLDDELRMSPTLQFKQSEKGGVTVDWGDGSAPETYTNALTVWLEHTYDALGDYVITLERSGSATYTLGGSETTTGRENLGVFRGTAYEHILRKVELGAGVSDMATVKWVFRYYMELETITIPNTTLFQNTDYLFNYCMSLKAVVVPNASTVTLGSYVFGQCGAKRISLPKTANVQDETSYIYQFFGAAAESVSLPSALRVGTNPLSSVVIPASFAFGAYNMRKVVIPSGVKTIGKNAFKNCHSVSEFVVPSSVTTINSGAFDGCRGVEEYHFKATTPPTLEATDVFKYIPTDAIIYVPYNVLHTTLNAYKNATNWSTYASQIMEEPH